VKKIVVITDAWAPQVNGVVTVLQKTNELLEEHDFSVTVIHPGLFRTVPIFFYKEIRLALFPARTILSIFDTEQPDFIHIATEGPLGLAARKICKKKKLKFTTAYHTHFPLYIKMRTGFLTGSIFAYLRWFHSPAAATMVSTQSLADELASHGFKHLKISPLGVDTELFKRNDYTTVPEFPKPIFMYFGRIAIEKSVEEFLQCELPGTKLVIGNGPQRKQLESKYGKSATFIDYQKGQGLVDWISRADVFVFPSRTETFGLVVVEALACGVPVAAHSVMGPKDIITPGVDGFLSENLTEAALKCVGLSPEYCRKKAMQFTWENSVQAFISNLKQAVPPRKW
jgi:glycosyltransferase involved in cell wall biosynthesis